MTYFYTMDITRNKTKKQMRAFVLKVLLPYKQNPSSCAVADNNCLYLTSDGRKCAVGQLMKRGKWQQVQAGVLTLADNYDLTKILTAPNLRYVTNVNGIVDMSLLINMQRYHDLIADDLSYSHSVNTRVEALEASLGVKLPELKYTEEEYQARYEK